ncbi:MAG: PKD domain-containing protein, partial [Bacteroidetes bacterium]
MKHLLFILAYVCAAAPVWAQPAQTPAAYGGNDTRTLSLKTPESASLQKEAEYDYDKLNPRVRALAPRERKCGTVEVEKTRGMEDAGTRESTDHFEQWLDSSVTRMQQTRSVRRSGKKIYTIPVVVHVIYSNPVENITDEQVYSQIRVLNEDYRRRNPDQDRTPQAFAGLATDTDIEFCLASIDPSGRPSNGINRVSMPGAPFSERFVNETIKRQTGWDPNKYMNIWVCNLAGGILGFAQFPMSSGLSGIPASSTLATTDGVVISYNAFGTVGTVAEPFHKGRTATHEIGHWLGLRHTWGDADCAEDYCDDTPRTDGPSQACPDGKLGCDGANAMIQNYMDYTDDACMNLFTLNQKQRMIAVLENSPRRRSLLDSPVCQTVAEAPAPAFTSDVTTGCGPLKVRFSDRSKGSPEEWLWSFPGGKPEVSDQQNPEVIYRKGGTYPVRLTVTNAAGARTEEQLGYITVKERGEAIPFIADFEDNTVFPAMGMRVVNADRDATWEPSSRVSGFGQGRGALRIANFDNTLRNSTDWIITPALDLSSGANSALSFQVAYSPFDDTYSDTLGVFVAAGCGAEFRNIYYRGGRELATAEPYTQTFIPIETEWRTETIDLSSYDGEPFVQVAFVNFNGNGNDLYLDNIRVFASNAQAPQAHFAASDSSVCAGDKVTFTNLSSENTEKWVWA